MKQRLFMDTWGWVTLINTREPHHRLVNALLEEVSRSNGHLITSDYVLDETFTLLARRLTYSQLVKAIDLIELAESNASLERVWITPSRFEQAKQFRLKYHDKLDISFTDLTSMIVMQELGIAQILTADAHFQHVGLGFQLLPER